MVKVIMGLRGHGKTKQIIELVNLKSSNENECVVCIERGKKLTYDISHLARLVDISAYFIESFEGLKAFICGMYSANYDISHIFIDSLLKVAHSDSIDELEAFLVWTEGFGAENEVSFTFTISADENRATPVIKRFF